jgi:hypothetical protein
MKFDKWTIGLAAAGVVSMGVVAVADESPVSTLVSGTTLNGYVDTSAIYKPGVQSAAYRFVNTAPDTWNGFNFNVVDLAIETSGARVTRPTSGSAPRPRAFPDRWVETTLASGPPMWRCGLRWAMDSTSRSASSTA